MHFCIEIYHLFFRGMRGKVLEKLEEQVEFVAGKRERDVQWAKNSDKMKEGKPWSLLRGDTSKICSTTQERRLKKRWGEESFRKSSWFPEKPFALTRVMYACTSGNERGQVPEQGVRLALLVCSAGWGRWAWHLCLWPCEGKGMEKKVGDILASGGIFWGHSGLCDLEGGGRP